MGWGVAESALGESVSSRHAAPLAYWQYHTTPQPHLLSQLIQLFVAPRADSPLAVAVNLTPPPHAIDVAAAMPTIRRRTTGTAATRAGGERVSLAAGGWQGVAPPAAAAATRAAVAVVVRITAIAATCVTATDHDAARGARSKAPTRAVGCRRVETYM